MKVKEIINNALTLLGRADLASKQDGETLSAEEAETLEILLYCYNAVEDEIARCYFPLRCREKASSATGRYNFFLLQHKPVRIVKVLADGKEKEFFMYPEYMETDAKDIILEYEYLPSKKEIEDDSEFSQQIGGRLLAYGVASEYSLIMGEVQSAEIWEGKYRKEIENLYTEEPSLSGGYIPPRRWV